MLKKKEIMNKRNDSTSSTNQDGYRLCPKAWVHIYRLVYIIDFVIRCVCLEVCTEKKLMSSILCIGGKVFGTSDAD